MCHIGQINESYTCQIVVFSLSNGAVFLLLCNATVLDFPKEGQGQMGLVKRKPVFGVSIKAGFKPVSSATETSWKIEILPVARLNMVLSKKRITKALIRLHGCTGWSAPVLFSNPRRQAFSRQCPNCSCHLGGGGGVWIQMTGA